MTTTEDPERMPFLSDRTMRLICAAIDRDIDETFRLLGEIGDTAQTLLGDHR